VVGGEEQDSGVRIQESGFRSQNEEHLLSAFCLLPSADCLLLTADCLLQLVGVLVGGSLGPHRSLRQHVTAEKGRKN